MKFVKSFIFFLIIISISSFTIADDFDETPSADASEVFISTASTVTDMPQILSRRAIVFERNSKTVLFEKNSLEQCKMASTTKIMSCILILENCDLTSMATISSKAASTRWF